MIHLCYPHTHPDGSHHRAPWSIGHNLALGLRRAGHRVRQYDYQDTLIIQPGPGDILIGHPHPDAGYVFRNSLVGPWQKVIGISPWNGSEEYTAALDYVVPRCDRYFAICGPYWAERLPDRWENVTALDMAVDASLFPILEREWNPPGHRRFLYIGCTVKQKGTAFLEQIIRETGITVGHCGYGHVEGAEAHGFVDFTSDEGRALLSRYDFLIMPGENDANPTTVLEAMCWGMVPALTNTCGWSLELNKFWGIYQDDMESTRLAIEDLAGATCERLDYVQKVNRNLAKSVYNWRMFTRKVAAALELD